MLRQSESFPSSDIEDASRVAHVYLWNPNWQAFKTLLLTQKMQAFTKFVEQSQRHFFARDSVLPDEICIIIAPDLIFSTVEDEIIYSLEEKNRLDIGMITLQAQLSDRTLVIAGSAEYLLQDTSQYTITTDIITCNAIKTYAKKYPDYDRPRAISEPVQDSISMREGSASGKFQFHGLTIGLEICQDHQCASLKNELAHDEFVDIHILLSAGQSILPEHICTPIHTEGMFIQSELRPHETYNAGLLGKKILETCTYQVAKTETKLQSFRVAYIKNLGKKSEIQLKRQRAVELNQNVKLYQLTLQLGNSRAMDNVFDVQVNIVIKKIWQILNLPQTKQLTKTIPFPFFIKPSAEPPEGIAQLALMCLAYFRGTIKQDQLLTQIGEFASKKTDEWGLLRDTLTTSLYEKLSILSEPLSREHLIMLARKLDKIAISLQSENNVSSKLKLVN